MGSTTGQRGRVWQLQGRQHGLITRRQLLDLGFSRQAIEHRISNGRLQPVRRGVYAMGRPELTQHGEWLAAVLACGPEAVLSHASAAALWGIRPVRRGHLDISIPGGKRSRPSGIVVHRRAALPADEVTRRERIPVTGVVLTLIDIAAKLRRREVESAVNEADRLDLVDPERLRLALDRRPRRPGVGVLRELLDRLTFTLTDSELERLFLPLARAAGLPTPETQESVNGFDVDFYWPLLGLVVETDGLRYHRTPAQQARDRLRDQAHTAAGLTALRFTHGQVAFEPGYVKATLARVAERLMNR
jgi:very-short-patch-repair endonuclease